MRLGYLCAHICFLLLAFAPTGFASGKPCDQGAPTSRLRAIWSRLGGAVKQTQESVTPKDVLRDDLIEVRWGRLNTGGVWLHPDSLMLATQKTKAKLDEFGLHYDMVADFEMTYLGRRIAPQSKTKISSATAELLVIRPELSPQFKAKGKRSPDTLALEHPDFLSYAKTLEEKGIDIVIDTSLDHEQAVTMGYTVRNRPNRVHLSSRATFGTLLHEHQHLKLDSALIAAKIPATGFLKVLDDPGFRRFLLRFKDKQPEVYEQLSQAWELRQKGLGETAIHETMAVEVQVKAYLDAGFKNWSPDVQGRNVYALRWKIEELKAIPEVERTQIQIEELFKARINLYLAERYLNKTKFLSAVKQRLLKKLPFGSLALIGGAFKIMYDPDSDEKIIISDDGTVVRLNFDGASFDDYLRFEQALN